MTQSVCIWCSEPLTPHQAVKSNSCGAPECERKRIVELAKSETRRHLDDHDDLLGRMQAQCSDMLKTAGDVLQSDVAELGIGVVPYNDKPLTRLPTKRRQAFEAHLQRIAEEGFAIDKPEIHTSKYIRQAIDLPEASITDAACATCMGDCCKAGGPSWAFMDETTVCRFRVAHPNAGPEDFYTYYLDQLPDRSVQDNCVFQSATGCTLSRPDRADLCNSFLCRGVNRLLKDHDPNTQRSTAIIAQHEGKPRAIGLFDGTRDTLSRILPIEGAS